MFQSRHRKVLKPGIVTYQPAGPTYRQVQIKNTSKVRETSLHNASRTKRWWTRTVWESLRSGAKSKKIRECFSLPMHWQPIAILDAAKTTYKWKCCPAKDVSSNQEQRTDLFKPVNKTVWRPARTLVKKLRRQEERQFKYSSRELR